MNFIPEKHLKWWTQDQTCNLLTSILNLMAEKVSKILLIVPSIPNYILPKDHLTIINLVLTSFMIQLTSIVSKRIKFRSKRRKYPMHTIVLRKPAQIRSKKTAQFWYLYFYIHEYSDNYKSPAYFCPNILYLYEHNYLISVLHLCCKHHHKIPPHVTPLLYATLHTNI